MQITTIESDMTQESKVSICLTARNVNSTFVFMEGVHIFLFKWVFMVCK